MNEYGTLIVTTIAIVFAGALIVLAMYLIGNLRPSRVPRTDLPIEELLDIIAATPPNVKIRAILSDGTMVESFPNPFGIEYEPEWVDLGYTEEGWTFHTDVDG